MLCTADAVAGDVITLHMSLVAALCHLTCGNHDAKRLYDDLLRKNNYNKLIRPGANPLGDNLQTGENFTLEVRLGLRLAQIIDVVRTLGVRASVNVGIQLRS